MIVNPETLQTGAQRFELNPASLHSLGGTDGAVYSDQHCVLKFVPTSPEKLPATQAKLDFARYLQENDVPIAAPLPSIQSKLLEIIETSEGSFAVTKFPCVPGHHVDSRNAEEWNPAFFQRWGQIMGRMHALTKTYPHTDAIGGWKQEHLSFAEWCRDEEVRSKWLQLGETIQTYSPTPDCFGLVHNDLHQWNMMYDHRSLTIIDFDVCNYQWFATDLAIPVFHSLWATDNFGKQHQGGIFARYFLENFMRGYRQENEIDPIWLERLPLFLNYRRILLHTVFTDEWRNGDAWQKRLLSLWRQEIVNDVPVVEEISLD
jgi:Ser/Thr protein kinase RdoA (MazF antagonist)